jgi:hypothetical protein
MYILLNNYGDTFELFETLAELKEYMEEELNVDNFDNNEYSFYELGQELEIEIHRNIIFKKVN